MKNEKITVVFTAYKRPETLPRQIDAILHQSVRPNELILFQDRVQSGEPVVLDESLLDRFDMVKISTVNQGVWGRFKFAKENATGDYICVLDDDTIPAEKWIETCVELMKKREAVYASLGIRLTKQGQYPFSGYYRIGWCSANKKCEEVDFAGHSWFFKKKCLEWMFDGTEDVQNIKTAGEDMGLSFAASRHGIPTIITPHPLNERKVWGSLPNDAMKYGNDSAAIGVNGNYNNMNRALELYNKKGWQKVVDKKAVYVYIYRLFQKIKLKLIRKRIVTGDIE